MAEVVASPGGSGPTANLEAEGMDRGVSFLGLLWASEGSIIGSGSARSRCSAPSSPGTIGLLFLLPFPSWAKLVGVVTDALVLMYAGAPLALGALRLRSRICPGPTGCR